MEKPHSSRIRVAPVIIMAIASLLNRAPFCNKPEARAGGSVLDAVKWLNSKCGLTSLTKTFPVGRREGRCAKVCMLFCGAFGYISFVVIRSLGYKIVDGSTSILLGGESVGV